MRRSSSSATIWVVLFVIIAFIGFADSVYLTASHYIGELPTCTVVEGCDEVALSEYSTIGPVPLSLLGVLFYTLMIVWGVVWLDSRKKGVFRFMPLITIPAFLFSMWLIYVMFYVIDALCIYCLISSGTTTLLMLLSLKFSKKL